MLFRLLLVSTLVMLLSCDNNPHSPSNAQIQEAVKRMYERRSEADGAGGWIVNEVQVIKNAKGMDDKHYIATVKVKGVNTSPALAVPRPDRPIDETVDVELEWKDGKWVVVE